MRIGVMSDSHDNLPMIGKAIDLFAREGIETVLHAGDFIAPFAVKELMKFDGNVVAVFGNNDGEKTGILKLGFDVTDVPRMVAIANRQILLSHAVARNTEGADIVVSGHTHEVAVQDGTPLLLNPGECGGWLSGRCTVAILDLESLDAEIREL